jgi:hypothetical protein
MILEGLVGETADKRQAAEPRHVGGDPSAAARTEQNTSDPEHRCFGEAR